METIKILHTNDIHSHLENWPRIAHYIQSQQQAFKDDETLWTLDLGDFCDRWHPLTEATHGKGNIALLNQAHYDLITLGNNEGLGFSQDEFKELYQQANFQVVIANVRQLNQQLPPNCHAYTILTTKNKTKIAFIGLTAPFESGYRANDWLILDPQETLRAFLPELKQQADLICVMSHLGVKQDRLLAKKFPAIDLIIGSHTHHVFVHGEFVNQTLLAAAGKYGRYVGEITLTLENHQLKEKRARTICYEDLPPVADEGRVSEGYFQEGQHLLAEQVLCTITEEKSIEKITAELAQAMKAATNQDLALLNTGLVLHALAKGVITKKDLHEILPHLMHLVTVQLKGRDLIRLAAEIAKNQTFLSYYQPKGLGFRGKIFGQIYNDGLVYHPESQTASLRGKAIAAYQSYSLVTLDYWVFLPFFPTLEIAGEVTLYYPKLLREIYGEFLARNEN